MSASRASQVISPRSARSSIDAVAVGATTVTTAPALEQRRDLGGGTGVAADHEGGGAGGQVHGPSIRSVARSLRVVSGLRTAMRTHVSSRPGNVSARRTA